MNLSKFGKFTRVSDAVAAGTSAVNGSSIDMQGFNSVTFVVALGAVTDNGVGTLKAQQSSDNGSSDAFSDLEGASVAYMDTDGSKLLILEVTQPRERYVRPVVTRSTANAVVDVMVAIQTAVGYEPVTHAATVAGVVHCLAPDEAA